MTDRPVRKVIIVGGGTAGWVSAALLVKVLGKALDITLIESDQIGIVGVGEATIPPIIDFNNAVGIDEAEFLRETHGSIKLGIQFENWGRIGDRYMHAFGTIGKDFPFCQFYHFWVRSRQAGIESDLWDFSLNYQAAAANKFDKLAKIETANLPGLSYAYHFDASAYSAYLRRKSEAMGVRRQEGLICDVDIDGESGFVEAVRLEDGTRIAGDFFIDCSGMRALLIGQALNTGYEEWSHWLPCDRAVAVPCESVEPFVPYTRAIAHGAGWQWRIPLQHRIGNGLVYSSRNLSDDEATAYLLDHLDGPALAEPRRIPFRTGRRIHQWQRNVVSIGLSSGFLEPLESTSIHLIQTAITRLIKHFPQGGFKTTEIDEYNRQSKEEFERIRDFIILHYKLTDRDDTPFWRECRRMDVPDDLAQRMALFRDSGKLFRRQDELFTEMAWQQVLIGQGMMPDDYHPLVNALSIEQLEDMLKNLRVIIDNQVARLPGHAAFLKDYCRA